MKADTLKEFAGQYNIDPRILVAILNNESEGRGFDKDGNIKTRFEVGIWSSFIVQYNEGKKNPILPGLSVEWVRSHTKDELRLLATSYGIAQIMGWHYPMLNYNSIGDLVSAWTDLEEIQIIDFCIFCVKYRDGKFLKALQELDFKAISIMYNGLGYLRNDYDNRLHKNFNVAVL